MATHEADALSVLAADHKAISQLFAEYDELITDEADAEERMALAATLCDALTAHTAAEEDVFYPAAARAVDDEGLIDEALGAHDGVRAIIEEIESLEVADGRFDALVMLLSRAVAEHVRQEEGEIFPLTRAAGLDLKQLGEQVVRRREEVMQTLADEAGG